MKKIFLIVGMITSIFIIIFGILSLSGALGDAQYYGSDSPYSSGYASFGADYYTYSVNNTAETTSAVNAVSSNLCAISELLKNTFGLFMIGFGLMFFCGFGAAFASCITTRNETNIVVEKYADEEDIENIKGEIQGESDTD